MGLIKKVDDITTFKEKMTQAEIIRMAVLDRELSPSNEIVKLGSD